MKKGLFCLILTLSAFAGATEFVEEEVCEPCRYYVCGFGGANWFHAEDFEWTKFFRVGYVAGLTLGYQINSDWHIEAEVSYRRNTLNHIKCRAGCRAYRKIHFDLTTVMANVLYDIPFGYCYVPYVGLGLGYGCQVYVAKNKHFSIRRSCNRFVGQIIVGVKRSLTERVDLGLEYRFLEIIEPNDYNQSVGLSLSYHF